MTIKQEIVNFVRNQNHPCTRKEIVRFYENKYCKYCGNLTSSLARPYGTGGYLMTGPTDHLVKIGRNQYIAC